MTMLPTYFPSPPQGVWHLGPLPIRAYALFIITGIVVALLIGDRRWEARGGERGVIYDVALWAVPFGLVGGRLYHLATDWRTYWGPGGAGLGAALRIWDGGLGIWGAVALGCVGAWIGCRRHGVPLPAFTDAVAPGIVLAQAIGRLGNYFNQELYGRETTLPWGLEIFYRRDPAGYVDPHSLDGVSTGQVALVVQPTFLYELIWNVLVFVLLIYADRRFRFGHGRLFALYVAAYCVGRFCIELLRADTATHIAGIRINSFTSTFVFIGAVVYIILAPKGREAPESLRRTDYFAEGSEESEPEPEPSEEPVTAAPAAAAAVSEDDEQADAVETLEAAQVAEPETAELESVEAETKVVEAKSVEPEVEGSAEVESAEAEAEAESVEAEAEAESVEAGVEQADGGAGEPEAEGSVEAEVESAEVESVEAGVEQADGGAVEPEAEGSVEAEVESAEAEAEVESAEAGVEQADGGAGEPEVEASVEAEVDAEVESAEAGVEQADGGAGEPEVEESAADSESDVEADADDEESEPQPVQEPADEAPVSEQHDEGTRRRWRLRFRNRR